MTKILKLSHDPAFCRVRAPKQLQIPARTGETE